MLLTCFWDYIDGYHMSIKYDKKIFVKIRYLHKLAQTCMEIEKTCIRQNDMVGCGVNFTEVLTKWQPKMMTMTTTTKVIPKNLRLATQEWKFAYSDLSWIFEIFAAVTHTTRTANFGTNQKIQLSTSFAYRVITLNKLITSVDNLTTDAIIYWIT